MRHGTYSIVALDPATGELGAAVQSHWFSRRLARAPGRAPGVGAVATQSVVEPAYGPNALDRLAAGRVRAPRRSSELLGGRPAAPRAPGRRRRRARAASRSTPGADCIAARRPRDRRARASCQANMMARDTVPAAMSAAFEAADGRRSPQRLLAALEAARGRGRRRPRAPVGGAARRARRRASRGGARVDLRVEDHDDPLAELRRLLALCARLRAGRARPTS